MHSHVRDLRLDAAERITGGVVCRTSLAPHASAQSLTVAPALTVRNADGIIPPMPETGEPDVILDIALQFGAALDLDQLLPAVIERVASLMKAERALFALCERDGSVSRAVCHNLEWAGPGHPLPISSSVFNEVLTRREPVVVLDALSDQHLRDRRSVREFRLRRIVGVPVEDREGGCSVLYVDSSLPSDETPGDGVARLSAIARLVGTAVENARLFEEQRFRNQLLGELVHDLRGPLTVIRTHLAVAKKQSRPIDSGETNAITASTARMKAMIQDTLELAQADAGAAQLKPAPVDVSARVQEHLDQLATVAEDLFASRFELDVGSGPLVAQTIDRRVAVVLDNLAFNALKYGQRERPIHVTVRRRDDAGPLDARARPPHPAACLFRRLPPVRPTPDSSFVEVSFHNRGRPLTEAQREGLFAPYVSGPDGNPSAGLGLSIVDQCVRHLGGAVWTANDPDHGTTFAFTLPMQVVQASTG